MIYLLQLVLCIFVDVKGLPEYRLYLTYINPYFRIFGEGMLGIFLCEGMPVIQEKISRWSKSVVEVTALVVFVVFFLLNNVVKNSTWSAWIWFVPVTLMLIAFNGDSGATSRSFQKRGWQFLGKVSFELYMTHAFVYEGLPVIVGIVSNNLRSWIVYHAGTRFAVTFVLSLIFAWCVYVVLKWITKKSDLLQISAAKRG